MLRRIPFISPHGLDSYFDSIDSKLYEYENLKDAPMLLELAIWKSKITEQTDLNNVVLASHVKMQCRCHDGYHYRSKCTVLPLADDENYDKP
jgi:hypothetical protein